MPKSTWPQRTSTAPSSGCRPATSRSSRSPPSSRTGFATAPSAIPPATWSASRSSADSEQGGRPGLRVRPVCGVIRDTPTRRYEIAHSRAGHRHDGDTMTRAQKKATKSPALHAADSHDLIRVHGARENNLKNVYVELPKRRLTVFTGVSGSGKSSLVFNTIAAESQRLINETYSAFVQGFMPTLARPDVDVLEGMTTAIIVDQERMGSDPRSTVGTATDANAMLRILFSRLGEPHAGPPTAFSFNVPTRKASGVMSTEKSGRVEKNVVRNVVYLGGMCPRCEGMGAVSDFDLTALYDESRSLSEGALTIPG